MFRPLERYQLTVDIVVAVLFFLGTVLFTVLPYGYWNGVDTTASVVAAVVLTAGFSVALGIRRWSPPLALTLAWVLALVQMSFGLPPLPANVAIFGILYVTAAYGTRTLFWVGFASAVVGAVAITAYLIVPPLIRGGWSLMGAIEANLIVGITVFFSAALALLLSWTVGALVRTALRARENRRAQERAEAETVVEAERNRIARDMHDVVAHSLAVVIAQADGARYAAARNPDAATDALAAISGAARSALADVRMLLTQLRHSEGPGPQPTLADLEQLYAHVRAAGVDLRVDVDPAPVAEPPAAAQLAVYRILQEALTNALRHGAGGAVDVGLSWHPDRVRLIVRNPASAGSAPGDGRGHGLIGMRERAQLVGGTFEAGLDGDVFTVRATVPIGAAA
ncbi:MAG: histidine kinase [Candidatus Microbacterium phytovorans]|uniref:histidine kinase n=1 Tax=Candidatus Microbacterium phytovorans TaxID=3121374 RepID=A0AAJ5W0A0_9MICO|nr:histidine kinase [Microbacterium sp.]WEK13524.1 MAG: histidine kinase [Microbacterium sp.]